jgi:glycine C-acetyltransferase
MSALGFTLVPGEHPIIPVMLGDAQLASRMADAAERRRVCDRLFVPGGAEGSRAHSHADERRAYAAQIDRAVDAFARVGRSLGII